MKVIDTKNAPGAIGPYSQGFITNGLVFTSGQIPVNPANGEVPEGITAQTEQSCKNVAAILEAAGSGMDKVVKTTCFLADIADFAAFNEVDAIAAIPPIYFKLPEYAIAQYWNDYSSAAPNTDFIIYNIPQLAGVALSRGLYAKMRENKNVIGVKNSSMPVF